MFQISPCVGADGKGNRSQHMTVPKKEWLFLHPSQHARTPESVLPSFLYFPMLQNLHGLDHNHCASVKRNPLQLQVLIWEKQLSVEANNSSFSNFSHHYFTLLQAQQFQKMNESCIPALIHKALFPTDLRPCISAGDIWYIITAVLREVQFSQSQLTHR